MTPTKETVREAQDHPVIWLAPDCREGDCGDDRTWCQDNVYEPCHECGKEPTLYIRADVLAAAEARAERAEGLLEDGAGLEPGLQWTLRLLQSMQYDDQHSREYLTALDDVSEALSDAIACLPTTSALAALDAADDAVMQGAAVEAMAEALEWIKRNDCAHPANMVAVACKALADFRRLQTKEGE